MADEVNYYSTEVDGNDVVSTLMVTIALEEYRSLVRENTRLKLLVEKLSYENIELKSK